MLITLKIISHLYHAISQNLARTPVLQYFELLCWELVQCRRDHTEYRSLGFPQSDVVLQHPSMPTKIIKAFIWNALIKFIYTVTISEYINKSCDVTLSVFSQFPILCRSYKNWTCIAVSQIGIVIIFCHSLFIPYPSSSIRSSAQLVLILCLSYSVSE